eukprot:GHVO01018628.1.p1 GENE.GHVO01018628.1~~GHVO01018628.1.p1  ORF type:complete len:168 (+),score=12.88 GHVO01018628.1:45-506(+)
MADADGTQMCNAEAQINSSLNHDEALKSAKESCELEKQWRNMDIRTREITISLDNLQDELRSMTKVINGLNGRTDRFLTNPGFYNQETSVKLREAEKDQTYLKRQTESPFREVETGLLELEAVLGGIPISASTRRSTQNTNYVTINGARVEIQ